jgi:AcrR family transcriptional regulator
MARWEPNARGRLEQAAMELFTDRGFEQTTVAAIAERAGLTERTFFRYFDDKREVIFGGGVILEELVATAVADAPGSATPLEATAAALDAVGALIHERRDFARQRQAIVAAHPELQERELIKLASLASALAEALRQRGVEEPQATLAAELAIAVFRTAYERWHRDGARSDLRRVIRQSLAETKTLLAAAA